MKNGEKNSLCSCPNDHKSRSRRSFPFLFGFIIAILPKCPFCLLAYSSAAVMCSGAAQSEHSPGAVSFISIFLALVIIVNMLFKNPRFLTLLLALGGGVLVVLSELYTGSLTAYYLGAWLLLSAIVIDAGWLRFLWEKLTKTAL